MMNIPKLHNWSKVAEDAISGKASHWLVRMGKSGELEYFRDKENDMEQKALDITNTEEVKEKGSDIKVHGNPDRWVCVIKASSEKQGWMKSTKVMEVRYDGGPSYGCLVQVSTEKRNPDGSTSLAEAVTYCPEATLKMFK